MGTFTASSANSSRAPMFRLPAGVNGHVGLVIFTATKRLSTSLTWAVEIRLTIFVMGLPTDAEILTLLDHLDSKTADDLETQWLEFKPWQDQKVALREAYEYSACFASAGGGVLVFGVLDRTRGRSSAIQGAARYDLDLWKSSIFDNIRPHLAVQVGELVVPEGTGRLLVVRVPKGDRPPYGTASGIFKQRVGKSCMPLDPSSFQRQRVSTGAVDWSGEVAEGVPEDDLDPLELARARAILKGQNPESELLRAADREFLGGLGAMRSGRITNTGLLLFGRPEVISELCPQSQTHYVYQSSETAVDRNDVWRGGLLLTLETLERIFLGPTNPEEELSVGLFKLRIPAFPIDAVREALLNAVTHRDYSDPGEVLVRHDPNQLVVTSPGNFVGGITVENILRHEPVARNRTLANALMKLRLVESAGVGRRRMFVPTLSYGKRPPQFASDGHSVTLRLFNTGYDKATASRVARWKREGLELGLDSLMVLSYLREQSFVDANAAADLLQLDRSEALRVLEQMSTQEVGIVERRGHTRSATYHLTKGLAKELLGKAAYTRSRGLNPKRYAELVREYLQDHQTISNREVRDLLNLGESASAKVEAARYLRRWSSESGFLTPVGAGNQRRYQSRQGS